jgi:hypothetical protein
MSTEIHAAVAPRPLKLERIAIEQEEGGVQKIGPLP